MTGATQDDLFDDESGVVMTTIECKVIEAMGKVLEYVKPISGNGALGIMWARAPKSTLKRAVT